MNGNEPTDDGTESSELNQQTISQLVEELYLAAYQNHDDLDDITPGYEYATQQLCSEMRTEIPAFTHEVEMSAMNRAQTRYDERGDSA